MRLTLLLAESIYSSGLISSPSKMCVIVPLMCANSIRCNAPVLPISLPRRSSWVSVCVDENLYTDGTCNEKIHLTEFCRNASFRICAPVSPISFSERSNWVSACFKDNRYGNGRCKFIEYLTVFCRSASLRYRKPVSPIPFEERTNKMSVCVDENRYYYLWPVWQERSFYLVALQGITQIMCSFFSNLIVTQIQSSKYLREKVIQIVYA
jgi:hypothetical protein